MQTFMVALAECELLTLANGDRLTPIISDGNPNGYTPRTILTNPNGSITVIPADDIFKRDHDVKKQLVILNIVTAKDLHYCSIHLSDRRALYSLHALIHDPI